VAPQNLEGCCAAAVGVCLVPEFFEKNQKTHNKKAITGVISIFFVVTLLFLCVIDKTLIMAFLCDFLIFCV
jgi:hypothetical protein